MPVLVEPVTAHTGARSSSIDFVSKWWPAALFSGAAVASAVVLMHEGRGLTFFLDEWVWILDRRDPSLDALLQPHVGHLYVLQVAIYELLLHLLGLTHYAVFRVLVLVVHLSCVALVFVYLRRRLAPVVALVPAFVLLFFGAAWQDLLWPFQVGFLLSVGAGVGAMLLIDTRDARAGMGVMGCVAVALASSSIGLPVTAGIVLELVLLRRWRTLRYVAIPVFFYAVWYVSYTEPLSTAQGVVEFGRFGVEAAGAVVGALVGAGNVGGQWLLLVVVPLVTWAIVRAEAHRRPRLLALAAIPVVFWLLLAVSRSGFQPPSASRYLYPAGVFVVLLAAECLRGVRLASVALVGLVAVGAWSVSWNLGELRAGREVLLPFSLDGRVKYGALDIGVRGIDPAYVAVRPPVHKAVREYVAAFRDLDSPGASPAEIRQEPEARRRIADAFLIRAAGLRLGRPLAPAGDAPVTTRGEAGQVDGTSCLVLASGIGAVDGEIGARTPALYIEALGASAVDVRLRNFGDEYSTFEDPWATIPAGEARNLPVPRVTAGPWRVGLRTSASVRVCGADLPSR